MTRHGLIQYGRSPSVVPGSVLSASIGGILLTTQLIGRTIHPMFTELEYRESAVEGCARQIRGAILRGSLFPSERLPPERELASMFGVNRMTVRNALAQLAGNGLLSVRQGSGYRVQDFRRSGGPDLLHGLAHIARESGDLPSMAADLLLMRRHMARAVFERIANRQNEIHVSAIREAIARFSETASSNANAAAIASADMQVLIAILDATGSPVLGLCLNPIISVLSELPELRDAIYAEPEANVAAYRILSSWLIDPQPNVLAQVFAELARRDDATVARLRASS